MQLANVGEEDVKLPPDVVRKRGVNAMYSQGSYAYLRVSLVAVSFLRRTVSRLVKTMSRVVMGRVYVDCMA